jgi:hypothetical protein
MKLNEKDFVKSADDNYITYQYSCNGNVFYLKIDVWTNTIYVYKNDEWDVSPDPQTGDGSIFKTRDYIQAWTKFEELVLACAPQQQSSGGFSNPQNNPKLMPLLAIRETYDKLICVFFVLLDDGNQQTIEMFEIDKADFTLPSNWQTEVFVADWSNLSVPKLFKSEILFKKFDDIVWETDPDALVFLFIPKNILQQSGEDKVGKGEPKNKVKNDINEPKEPKEPGEPGEPTNEPGEPGEPGEPTDEPGEPTDEPGEPTDEPGEPTDEPGEPTDEPGEPTDEPGEPTDEPGEPGGKKPGKIQPSYKKPDDIPVSEILKKLSDNINMKTEVIQDFFTRPKFGSDFLKSNNFEKIKKDLNLDPNTTSLQLAERINSQIK